LTEAGREIDAVTRGTVEAAVRRALASRDDGQIETVRAGLVKVADEPGRELAVPVTGRARRRRA
jgi:hypothetical protein